MGRSAKNCHVIRAQRHQQTPAEPHQHSGYVVVFSSAAGQSQRLRSASVVDIVRYFPFAVVRTMTFGEQPRRVNDRAGVLFGKQPRQAADAHLLLLAGSQHRCSVDRAEALIV